MLLILNREENLGVHKIVDISKFSNENKLCRITTWVKRFCINFKKIVRKRKEILRKSFLTATALRQVESDWIKIKRI